MRPIAVLNRDCPPELDKRMHAGVSDILEIFDAHSDYTTDVRISVIASVLAFLMAPFDDKTATNIMRSFADAVAANRQSLKKHMEEYDGR